jgi:hypothetical protein
MRRIAALLLVSAALAVAGFARAEEPELAAREAAGLVPLEGENRLVLRDLRGSVSVRMGRPGELRFTSVALGDTAKPRPVDVWVSGSEIRFLPPQGGEDEPRELEIVSDPKLFVQAIGLRGSFAATGLQSGIEVSGDVLDVDVRGLGGSVDINTAGGRAWIENIEGDVTLRSRSCAAKLREVKGASVVALEGSHLEAARLSGTFEADLRDTQWTLADVGKPVNVRAVGGHGQARKLTGGGVMRFTAAPFKIEESSGEFDIETDADFQFHRTEAALHVNSYGGTVSGTGNKGLVEVRTDGSRVTLTEITGPARVQGDNLNLKLKGVTGELFVNAKSSELEIDGIGGDVLLQAQNSTVLLRNASQNVEVESEGGVIDIGELRAPLTLTADCEMVTIAWAATQVPKDSSVKNTGGGVAMSFPSSSLMRVEAESKYGTVESEIEGIEVNDSANSAKGVIGGAGAAPIVRIVADRDIFLTSGAFDGEGD